MKIIRWLCKVVVLISSIVLLLILLFPSFICEVSYRGNHIILARQRGFIFNPPVNGGLHRPLKIDVTLTLFQIAPVIIILIAGLIFLKWQSSKSKSNQGTAG